ncbi:hypothetical protein WA158_007254 [Blastocystis sp. Blastoise]
MSNPETPEQTQEDYGVFLFGKSNKQYSIESSVLALYQDSILNQLFLNKSNRTPEGYIQVDARDEYFPIILQMMRGQEVDLNSFSYQELKRLINDAKFLKLKLGKYFRNAMKWQKNKELQHFIVNEGGKFYKNTKTGKQDLKEMFFEDDIVIDLSNVKLSDDDFDRFCTIFEHISQPNLKHLLLEKCGLCETGMKRLSKLLLNSGTNIQTLNLAYNNIDSDSIKPLVEVFQNEKCPSLCTLDLSCNYLGELGIRSLFCASTSKSYLNIKKINLAYNDMGPKGCKYISKFITANCLPQLLSLNLSYNGLGSKGIQELSDAFLTDMGRVGVHHLCRALMARALPELRALEVNDNSLMKEGLNELHDTLKHNPCPLLGNIKMKFNYQDYSLRA